MRWGGRVKNDSSNGLVVAWRHAAKNVSRLNLCIYYSLYGGMWNLFCRAGHYPGVHNLLSFGGGTRLAMPSNIRAGLIAIEAWFRGYWGSPGLGGIRTAGLYTSSGLLEHEDTRLKTPSRVRMGLSFAWKTSLAIQILDFLLFNWLCVNPSERIDMVD